MSDRSPVTDEPMLTGLFVAALVTLAIVLLLIFARGPDDQDRSHVPPAIAVVVA